MPLLGTLAGGDRPGRGPRALRRAARPPRPARAALRDGARRGGGAGGRAERRLPAARAPELRARRPGDGDRLRRRPGSRTTCCATRRGIGGREIFLDRFLENAIEVDVDALCDGEDVWIGGVMQHVEEAGIHSGDSACVLPPHSLGARDARRDLREATRAIALGARRRRAASTCSTAVLGDDLYVIEANPRASRTVPFVSKATGVPLAKLACRLMLGERSARLRACRHDPAATTSRSRRRCCRSTASPAPTRCSAPRCARPARSWASRADFPTAFAKAQAAAGARLPRPGTVFLTVTDSDKAGASSASPRSCTTSGSASSRRAGTAAAISRMGIPVERAEQDRRGLARTSSTGSSAATSTSSSTRRPAPPRAPTATRSAAPRSPRGIPCITTIVGRDGRRAGDRRRRAHGRPAGGVAAGDPRRGRLAPVGAVSAARSRPSAAGSARSTAHERVGAYDVLGCADPAGRRRTRASSTCSPRASGGAGERTSGRSSRARSRSCARTTDGRARVPARGRRPGHAPAGELRAGDGLWLLGPLGRSGSRAPRGGAPAAAGRRRRRDRAAGDLAATARRRLARRCSASATRRTPRAPRSSATRASRPTTARSATTAS